MLGRVARAAAWGRRAAADRRSMATAPSTVSVDWDYLKSKMVTDDARTNVERLQDAFQARLSNALHVDEPPKIDWEYYKQALPQLQVDQLKADFDKYMSSVPDVRYNEEADLEAHTQAEKDWEGVASYARQRVAELEEAKAESEDHRLHDAYTIDRAFQRFDGLLEKEWLEWRNLNFESNLRAFSDIPSELTPEQEDALRNKIAERAGVEPSMLRDK